MPEARVEGAQVRHRLGAQRVAVRRAPRRHPRARQRGVKTRGREVVRPGGGGEAEAAEAAEGLRGDGVHLVHLVQLWNY